MNKLIHKYIFLLFCIVLSMPLAAQNTGNISGVVIDAKDTVPLAGAIVRIERTNLGDETDAKGNFSIPNVPPGTYSIVAAYVGYETSKIVEVIVLTDKFVKLNFILAVGEKYEIIEGCPRIRRNPDVSVSGTVIDKEWIDNTGIR